MAGPSTARATRSGSSAARRRATSWATAIDASLLAYDEAPSDGRSAAFAPTVSAGANGFALGWAGRF
jgi:hypothetical protein